MENNNTLYVYFLYTLFLCFTTHFVKSGIFGKFAYHYFKDMRKLFLCIILMMPFLLNAQNYYMPTLQDISVHKFNYGEYLNYMNGFANVKPYIVPDTQWQYHSKLCITYVSDNTLIGIGFSKLHGIEIIQEDSSSKLIGICYESQEKRNFINNCEQNLTLILNDIGFVYSKSAIVIPYTDGYDYYIIAISLINSSNINSLNSESIPRKDTYYNLQGSVIDPNTSNGQILIKTNGIKSEKILK